MATPVLMPRNGNSVETCLIMKWLKQKDDKVLKNEIICEVETDKATFEILAPENGVLLDVFFDEGEDVPVLTNIAVIGEIGENYEQHHPKQASKETQTKSTASKPEPAVVEKKTVPGALKEKITPLEKTAISPRAKNLAKKAGVNFESISGTGPNGRVIEKDIIKFSKNQELLTPVAKNILKDKTVKLKHGTGIGGRITANDILNMHQNVTRDDDNNTIKEIPLRGIRKIIADRMLSSLQNSAQLTLNSSADARNLLKIRKWLKGAKDSQELNNITISDLLHFEITKVLKSNPDLNSLLLEDKLVYNSNIHLGFAVDTPRGLMVPVIKNSQNLNLQGISSEAKRLAKGCLEGKIKPDELNGATFTVTNLGNFGIESFTPILNLPQTAILGVGNINLKPVQQEFGIGYIPYIQFSLTIDHRVIDGATGARFLQDLATTINDFDCENII